MGQLRVTLVRSLNSANKKQIATVKTLGLHKAGQQVLHQDNEAIRGMIRRVSHLVVAEEVEGDVQ